MKIPENISSIAVTTASHSVYAIERRGDGWFLFASHLPSATSEDINGAAWQIEEPAMPELGRSWILTSFHYFDWDNPDRIPGGGKITSPVVEIFST
jgi:hypothetical protein